MEYKLINENYFDNYILNLIGTYGANANNLLYPLEEDVQSPEFLDNIDKGAELLHSIIKNKGKIATVVDCDVDGYTSSAIIWMYIKNIDPEADLRYYIHSGKQHGLEDLIDEIEISNDKIDLIILPDSSSNDEVYHYRLKDMSIPVLVLDHHEANEYSKSAVVINNQLSKNYKNKQLTGAGVVYQFCRYYDSKYGYNFADNYCDLAALGIISDMGKVIEQENAYLIKKGLNQNFKNYFFSTLLNKQSYSIGSNLNSISIAFYITPLINALIRVGTMQEKENLFLAFIDGKKIVPSTKRGEKGLTEELAVQVTRNCVNARVHQNKDLDAAIERIEFKIEDEGLNKNQLLIIELDEEDILPSTLNGLLAMKLAAKYKRPTLVLRTNNEGISKGSLRGINNSPFKDLRGYLNETGLCEYAQGHAQAAGAGIKHNNIQKLIEKSNNDLSCYDFGQTYYEVNFVRKAREEDIFKIIEDIDKYRSIYGQGCPEPMLAITNIDISKKDLQIMGANKDTVKIEYNGISYMMFHAKQFINMIQNLPYNTIRLEIVGRGNINEWGGRRMPQIFIDDYNVFDYNLMF